MLLEYAGRPAEQQPYTCGWVTLGVTCDIPVIGDLFSVHLRDHHGVVGGSKVKVRCEWTKCRMAMNKENIVRHVTEMHLRYKFICDKCDAIFTRRYNLNRHVRRKHGRRSRDTFC